jgi:hypothetical protein
MTQQVFNSIVPIEGKTLTLSGLGQRGAIRLLQKENRNRRGKDWLVI